MDRIEPVAFTKDIIKVCDEYKQVTSYDIEILDNVIAKIRIYLKRKVFIDIFYNSDTGRIAYALITNNRRIFGADNTGSWHLHPFEKPNSHKDSKEISFDEFMKMVAKRLFQ